MAAGLGRKVTFTWGGVTVPGVQEKGLSINGEPIDISDDGSDGYRELLAEPGENTADLSISGVTKSHAFLADLAAKTVQKQMVMTWPDGAVLSGLFNLVSTGETMPYNKGRTFEASLQSAGAFTYTSA